MNERTRLYLTKLHFIEYRLDVAEEKGVRVG
jgi:hypothetical protein